MGSGSHIAAEYFLKNVAKVKAAHVPFRGGALAVQAALGNQVDLVASSFGVTPQIAEGKLTGLAVGSNTRPASMPGARCLSSDKADGNSTEVQVGKTPTRTFPSTPELKARSSSRAW